MALTPIEITFSILQPTLIFLGQIVGESSLVSMSENSTTDDSAEIAIAAGGMLKIWICYHINHIKQPCSDIRSLPLFRKYCYIDLLTSLCSNRS